MSSLQTVTSPVVPGAPAHFVAVIDLECQPPVWLVY